ncbi:hypothetical protein [Chryseolinea lacunae]|uniref:Uncharacterized protein n=1 Tax=Chryseolinea lacunae TaxID=2801331 RepID=A0ABS1KZD0_9BACT|nr:hypothetical protein [Chryseolinea lacunae]MBL0744821.1 hypothetical protein [Chryseolinea lacunae]
MKTLLRIAAMLLLTYGLLSLTSCTTTTKMDVRSKATPKVSAFSVASQDGGANLAMAS